MVLVEVKAFGVGIHDRYYVPGDMFFPGKAKFPYVVGSEGSGIISKVGSNVSNFVIGDEVLFTSGLTPQGGSWAQYVCLDASVLIPLPEKLTFEQGAAIPIAADAAINSVRDLNLIDGEKLFIAGASGAIGTLVIQMAIAKGIQVVASASSKNHDYLRSLGVEMTVDYSAPEWQAQVHSLSNGGVDCALAIQPGTVKDSMSVVRVGGRVVSVSGGDGTQSERNISIMQFEHSDDGVELVKDFVSHVANGSIKLVLEKVYSFNQALEALEKAETRHARGKLVVRTD